MKVLMIDLPCGEPLIVIRDNPYVRPIPFPAIAQDLKLLLCSITGTDARGAPSMESPGSGVCRLSSVGPEHLGDEGKSGHPQLRS
ncbi:hypothetical protein THICB2_860003 [Thiomonas sp. CB2]|nr:hypothetical protein THICB2_860003 [Thiomonas sp. CB2]VDY06175.1 protein of unknown function [Thiomonas sp. Bio17B3]